MNIVMLPVSDLQDNPKNFFRPLSQEELDELVSSIQQLGILHPLIVRKTEQGYEVLSGHQRKRAAEALGLKEVPCQIVNADDRTAELMLIDTNIETRQLTTMELARAIRRKKELLGIKNGVSGEITSAQCAEGFGISERQFRKLDKLNDLIPPFQELVDSGKLGITNAERLAHLPANIQQAIYEAFGDSICDLTSEEVKRLREQNDTGHLALMLLQKEVKELSKRLEELQDSESECQRLKQEIAALQAKKRELKYDIVDEQQKLKVINEYKSKSQVVLFELLQTVARDVQAVLPEIEATLEKTGVSESTAPYIRKWGEMFAKLGKKLLDVTEQYALPRTTP